MALVWLVKDPTATAQLSEMMFDMNANDLAAYIVGTGLEQFHREQHLIHTTEAAAKADLKHRLRDATERFLAIIDTL